MNERARALLWLDSGAACAAGCFVVAFREWLAALHGFASSLVLFLGVANLAYASYSGSLALRASLDRTPSRFAIDALVIANSGWVAVCSAVLVTTWRSASPFGVAHIAFEGLFVGALAAAEYRYVRPFAR